MVFGFEVPNGACCNIEGNFKSTTLALAIIWIAVLLEFNWVWGVLFIMSTVPALRTGQTYLVEPIRRDRNALMYWFIMGIWIVRRTLTQSELFPCRLHRPRGWPTRRANGHDAGGRQAITPSVRFRTSGEARHVATTS